MNDEPPSARQSRRIGNHPTIDRILPRVSSGPRGRAIQFGTTWPERRRFLIEEATDQDPAMIRVFEVAFLFGALGVPPKRRWLASWRYVWLSTPDLVARAERVLKVLGEFPAAARRPLSEPDSDTEGRPDDGE